MYRLNQLIQKINFSVKQSSVPRKSKQVSSPTAEELDILFATLNSSEDKPAILKITPSYSKQFIPKLCDTYLPPPISHLNNSETLEMDHLVLMSRSSGTIITGN